MLRPCSVNIRGPWRAGAAPQRRALEQGVDGHVDLVSVAPAAVGAAVQLVPAAQEVLLQDLAEGVPEVLDAVRVDDGVDGRVGVRHDDGDVHDDRRLLQLGVEEREAVEDVDGQPADGEQPHDDGQGLGRPDLLLQQAVVAVPVADTLELHLDHLLPGHGEDLQVDAQHDEERGQHADEEVKVDHVLHFDHALEEAEELAALQEAPSSPQLLHEASGGGVVPRKPVAPAALVLPVPAEEGDEADDEGQDP